MSANGSMNTVAWGANRRNADWPYHSMRTGHHLRVVLQQVGSGQGQAMVGPQPRPQHLVDGDVAILEGDRRGDDVQPPGPFPLLADQPQGLRTVDLQVGQP